MPPPPPGMELEDDDYIDEPEDDEFDDRDDGDDDRSRQQESAKVTEMNEIFRSWDESYFASGYDPTPTLTRLCTLLEAETEVYMSKNPDPFDERHPSRTDPDCELGRMLKLLFRKDTFMTRLVSDYMRDNFFTRQSIDRSSVELNVAACRLILDIMPGLEASAVFQAEFDNLIHRLYSWAHKASDPLSGYAIGLIAAAMDVQDIAVNFREQNNALIAATLKRLHAMHRDTKIERHSDAEKRKNGSPKPAIWPGGWSDTRRTTTVVATLNDSYVRKAIPIHPPTAVTYQILLLRYLTSMGEYQEFLGVEFEHNALQLVYAYVDDVQNEPDSCLAFEALKYLSSLLCHKKCAIEFIAMGGLEALLRVPRATIASTGVAITLYYLAYCEDAMERICQMPQRIITTTVTYALWLMSSAHDSARCHATMFFGLAFQFKVVLDEFDRLNGLVQIASIFSSILILQPDTEILNDDEECAERQLVRHVCVSLRRYMEAHLFHKYTSVTRAGQPMAEVLDARQLARAPKSSTEAMSEQVRVLQEMLPLRTRWATVENVLDLKLVPVLLRIIGSGSELNYNGRADAVRSALDVLLVCCVVPRVHMECCERLKLFEDVVSAGINIILSAAEGELVADADVQKSALAVLVAIVCAPIAKPPTSGRVGSARKKTPNRLAEDMLNVCWENVRSNNGIIVLLQLMETKMPITEADCLRGLACRALAGLARSCTVRQIIGKLPMFTSGLLQTLVRDPILQEKRAEHVQFQKYALELMERISGRTHTSGQMETSIANIHRSHVVAHTKIQFNEQQLHELIHEHLLARGLTETAATLKREAKLCPKPAPPSKPIDHHAFAFRSPIGRLMSSRSRLRYRFTSDFNASLKAMGKQPLPAHTHAEHNPAAIIAAGMTPPVLVTPIKIKKTVQQPLSGATTPVSTPADKPPAPRSLQKQICAVDAVAAEPVLAEPERKTNVSLESIVTEYLTNQHALCRNPVSTCPQFDLFVPHKCPDPRPNKSSGQANNFAMRHFRRQAGYSSRRLDRRQVHQHFSVARTIRTTADSDCVFSACDFTPCSSSLVVGTYSGEVRVFNINDCVEEFSYNCHESLVTNIACNRQGNLVLTSNHWRAPLSALYSIEHKTFTQKATFGNEEYTEFSNMSQDKVLGTKAEVATVYDLNTGQKVSAYVPEIYNQYSKNRATFNPTDELILSDGVLWDVRQKRPLHKFDKLNLALSGVFHPNGLEVVSNTEVWDLRTFHLLRTVPALDQCRVSFSSQNVVYGIMPELENQVDLDAPRTYETSFRALDAYDYSSIATVDVKRSIYDLAVNSFGSQIAVCENHGEYDAVQESVVRLYTVGRRKTADDEEDADDNDVEMSEDESASDGEGNLFGLRDSGRNRGRHTRNQLPEGLDDDDEYSVGSTESSTSTSSDDIDDGSLESSDTDYDDDLNRANRRRRRLSAAIRMGRARARLEQVRAEFENLDNNVDDVDEDMWETDENE